MAKPVALSAFFLLFLLSACGGSDDAGGGGQGGGDQLPPTEETAPVANSGPVDDNPGSGGGGAPSSPLASQASYRLVFEATWSEATHPAHFPAGARFEALTGAAHGDDFRLWAPGHLASDALRLLAERGASTAVQDRVRAAVVAGQSHQLLEGAGDLATPGSTTLSFEVTREHPRLSFLARLSPSPDWVVGLHGQDLRDARGRFVDRLEVEARIYDVGTDAGQGFLSPDAPAATPQPIALLRGSLENGMVDGAPAVGRFVLIKQ